MLIPTIIATASIVFLLWGIVDDEERIGAPALVVFMCNLFFGFGIYGMSEARRTEEVYNPKQYQILRGKDWVEFAINKDLSVKSDNYSIVSNPENYRVYVTTIYDHYDSVKRVETRIDQ